MSGGIINIVDSSHYSITDGLGVIINTTTRDYVKVEWSGYVNVPVVNIANFEIFIYIDISGNIIETYTEPTNNDRRNYIILGHLHSTGTNLIKVDST